MDWNGGGLTRSSGQRPDGKAPGDATRNAVPGWLNVAWILEIASNGRNLSLTGRRRPGSRRYADGVLLATRHGNDLIDIVLSAPESA